MPGRFRFRLEAVRKVRQQAQDAQQRVVAGVLREIGQTEVGVRRLTEELRAEVGATRTAQSAQRLDLARIRGHQFRQTWLQGRILDGQTELARQQARLEQERAKLAEASRRLKVIEKLRERQWERFVTEERRAEQRDNDETANQLHLRRAQKTPSAAMGV